MAQVMVNFRLDENVKKNMEQVCKEMGMSMSTAFTIFATKVGRERRIPFAVTADPFYAEENMMRLEKIVSDIETGRSVLKEHDLLEAT
ncbi:MAG: type II toxin-antitoxin system RelB/DinJ family antitoxin [Ruminococcaceae bacterium]|nr:type II toxin-antitoxin system RelB/DinJ family antitoxin [Oscillospiraceae bacterium]